MRRKLWIVLLTIVAAFAMAFGISACSQINNGTTDSGGGTTSQHAQLATPEVTISAKGVASWEKVPNAVSYVYRVDNGKEISTIQNSVLLEDGQSISVMAKGIAFKFADSEWSEPKTYHKAPAVQPTPEPEQLATPAVSIDETGLATWEEVEHASGYLYRLNGGPEQVFEGEKLEYQLKDMEGISVKAVGDGKLYLDSEWSKMLVHIAPVVEPAQLDTPEVTIDEEGIARWNAIEDASAYFYKIGDGEPVRTEETSVSLEDGQSISVKAVGDGVDFSDSEWSEPVTYHAAQVTEPVQLEKPVVSVNEDTGLATWVADDRSEGYICEVNGEEKPLQIENTYQLHNGDELRVKAVGDSENYTDSEWSDKVTYTETHTEPTPEKLLTPVVSLQGNVASWQAVTHADHYEYVITENDQDAQPVSTQQTSVELEDGQSIKVKAVGDGTNYTDSEWSNTVTYTVTPPQPEKQQLATPAIHVNETGLATWDEVDHADGYRYKVNGGEEHTLEGKALEYQLNDGEYIEVQAFSTDTEHYSDSAWGKSTTYTAPHVDPTKLVMSVVTIDKDGLATWDRVAGAKGYICEVNGTARAEQTDCNIQLQSGDQLRVKAVAENKNYLDSEYSALQTYTKQTEEKEGLLATFELGDDVENGVEDSSNDADGDTYDKSQTTVTYTDNSTNGKYTFSITYGETDRVYPNAWDNKGNGCLKLGNSSNIGTFTFVVPEGVTKVVFYVAGYKAKNVAVSIQSGQSDAVVTLIKDYHSQDGTYQAVEVTITGTTEEDRTIRFTTLTTSPEAGVSIDKRCKINTIEFYGSTAPKLEKLQTPVVEIGRDGLATWEAVPNASSYKYKVNGVEHTLATTEKLEVRLTDGQTITVQAVGDGVTYESSDWSEEQTYTAPVKLGTPTVSISDNGLASWGAVENAKEYEYVINDGTKDLEPVTTQDLSVQLEDGWSIKVRAIGDENHFLTGDYSDVQKYTAPEVITLDPPTVEIDKDGKATWAEVANATGYKYKLNSGEEVPVGKDATREVQLAPGQTIEVMAVGDGTKYISSEYSEALLYTATLKVPVVTVDPQTGKATWEAVEGATAYLYQIDEQTEVRVEKGAAREVTLKDGESIKVKAVGDDKAYKDSPWSESKTYHAPTNYGSEEAPLSVSEALALAKKECPNKNDVTKQQVYATGIVVGEYTDMTTYLKEVTIKDIEGEETNSILIYTIDLGSVEKPYENDTIVICGYIKYYNGSTYQFSTNNDTHVELISVIRGESDISVVNDGGATVNGLDVTATNGTTVTFTVTAQDGKDIVSVTVYGETLEAAEGNTYSFEVKGNATVTIKTKDHSDTPEPEDGLVASLTFDKTIGAKDLTADNTKVGSYTSTWYATRENFKWTISSFNNNNCYNGGWTYIKTGREAKTGEDRNVTGTITTSAPFAEAISKIVVTLHSTSKDLNLVKSFTLQISSTADFKTYTEVLPAITDKSGNQIQKGENVFTIESPKADQYYRIVVDCEAGSANGFVVVSAVDYYKQGEAQPEPTPLASPTLNVNQNTGEVTWDAVEGATGYTYTVNGENEQTIDAEGELKVTLENNDEISVIAKGDGTTHSDSAPATATYTHEHGFNGQYGSDETQHWKICQYCNKEIPETKTNHTYVEGKPGVCDVCGKVHEHSAENLVWKFEETTHYQECSVCHAHENEHTPDIETEQVENGHHNVCKQDGCTYSTQKTDHTYKAGFTDEGERHYQECSECGYKNYSDHTYEGGEFVSDNESGHHQECTACGHKTDTVSHVYGDYEDVDGKQHKHTCDCGYSETGDHVYDKKTGKCDVCEIEHKDHVPGEWKTNSTQHWHVCSICGGNETDRADHKYDGADHDMCSVCNYKRNHVHEWEWQTDDTQHWQKCKYCEEEQGRAPHTGWTEWMPVEGGSQHSHTTTCSEHEEQVTVSENHHMTVVKTNDIQHWNACADCSYESPDKTAHTWGAWQPAADGNHTRTSTCANHDPVTQTAPHSPAQNQKWDCTGETHVKKCPDCQDVVESHKADYEWVEEGGEHVYKCKQCGDVKYRHAPSMTWHTEDETNHWKKCTGATEDEPECTIATEHTPHKHDHYAEIEGDDTQHNDVCECGRVIDTEAHEYDKDKGDGKCTKCSHEHSGHKYENSSKTGKCDVCGKEHDHTDTLEWTKTEETHEQHCTVCGYVTVPATQHTYEQQTGKCDVCEQPHANHVYDKDTHKCLCGDVDPNVEKAQKAIDSIELKGGEYYYDDPLTVDLARSNETVKYTWSTSDDTNLIIGEGTLTIKLPTDIALTATKSVTLNVAVTVGDVTLTKAFTFTLHKGLIQTGEVDDPFTVEDVQTIFSRLTKDNPYYCVKETKKKVYVEGYVTALGELNQNSSKIFGLNNVCIGPERTSTKDESVLSYNVNWGVLQEGDTAPTENPLSLKDKVVIYGFLGYYTDKDTNKSQYEITHDNESSKTYPEFTKWEKYSETPEYKLETAMAELTIPATLYKDYEIPELSVEGVTLKFEFKYESEDENVAPLTYDEGACTLKVHKQMGKAVGVTITVTFQVEGEEPRTQTYDVLVAALGAYEGEAKEVAKLSFTEDDDRTQDDNSGGYTSLWNAKRNGIVWTIKNFHNNNNGWNLIKTGHNTTDLTGENAASITVQLTDKVAKIVANISITSTDLAHVEGFYLLYSATATTESKSGKVSYTLTDPKKVSLTMVSGDNGFEIPSGDRAENLYYQLVIETKHSSNNGFVQLNSVTYSTAAEMIEGPSQETVTAALDKAFGEGFTMPEAITGGEGPQDITTPAGLDEHVTYTFSVTGGDGTGIVFGAENGYTIEATAEAESDEITVTVKATYTADNKDVMGHTEQTFTVQVTSKIDAEKAAVNAAIDEFKKQFATLRLDKDYDIVVTALEGLNYTFSITPGGDYASVDSETNLIKVLKRDGTDHTVTLHVVITLSDSSTTVEENLIFTVAAFTQDEINALLDEAFSNLENLSIANAEGAYSLTLVQGSSYENIALPEGYNDIDLAITGGADYVTLQGTAGKAPWTITADTATGESPVDLTFTLTYTGEVDGGKEVSKPYTVKVTILSATDLDSQKVNEALGYIKDTYTVEKTGTTTLEPTQTVEGVELTWAYKEENDQSETYPLTPEGVLTVDRLPDVDTTLHLTVTATCNGKSQSKDVTVTISAINVDDLLQQAINDLTALLNKELPEGKLDKEYYEITLPTIENITFGLNPVDCDGIEGAIIDEKDGQSVLSFEVIKAKTQYSDVKFTFVVQYENKESGVPATTQNTDFYCSIPELKTVESEVTMILTPNTESAEDNKYSLGLNSKSYVANNSTHNANAIDFTTNQVMLQGSVMQFQSGSGYIKNTDAMPGRIKSITFDVSNGSFTLSIGNTNSYGKTQSITTLSKTFTAEEGTNYLYFQLKVGSSTGKIASITINYATSVTEVSGRDKITAALAALEKVDDITEANAEGVALPASTDEEVTFTWSNAEPDATFKVEDNKLIVSDLPKTDTTVNLTVTATCGTAKPQQKPLTVKVTGKETVAKAKITEALEALGDHKFSNVTKAEDVELPQSTVDGVKFVWESNNGNYPVELSGDKYVLKVDALPADETEVTLTLKPEYDGIKDETQNKTFEVMIEPEGSKEETLVFDFSVNTTADTTELNTSTALIFFKSAGGGAPAELKELTNVSRIYKGNNSGGYTADSAKTLKMGSGNGGGKFTLIFTKNVTKIVVKWIGWGSSEGDLTVENVKKTDHSNTKAIESEWVIATPKDTISFSSTKRLGIYSITVYFE